MNTKRNAGYRAQAAHGQKAGAAASSEAQREQRQEAGKENIQPAPGNSSRANSPEGEANAFSGNVVRRAMSGFIQRHTHSANEEEQIQQKPIAPFIQKMSEGSSSTVQLETSSRIYASKGGGDEIPAPTKSFMEERFNADFSNVRIHSGSEAGELASNLQAQAFTVGNDIFFNKGKFSPGTSDGSRLLAHELTHTIQQGAATSLIQRSTFDHEDRMHEGVVDSYRRHRGYDPDGADGGPSASAIKYQVNLPKTPALTTAQVDSRIERFLLLAGRQTTLLSTSYISSALAARATNTALNDIFLALEAEVSTLDFDDQMAILERSPQLIIPLLERQFINDPATSSLDLLPDDPSRYRTFEWDKGDFPGGPAGPNEARAINMHNALSELRPERRANSGKDAVISRAQFEKSEALRNYVSGQLEAIPDFDAAADGTQPARQPKGHQLNRNAQEAYIRMRNAAQADGVFLIIGSSYRTPQVAAANAAAANNPNAVASFSSHSLGLAFDLNLSYTDAASKKHTYSEMTTNPMQNVVNMRESAAHKWMFLHGADYGYYPFQQEPWHWEYNPPGFPDSFMEGFRNRNAPPVAETETTENP